MKSLISFSVVIVGCIVLASGMPLKESKDKKPGKNFKLKLRMKLVCVCLCALGPLARPTQATKLGYNEVLLTSNS